MDYLRLCEARGWLLFWHTPNQRSDARQRQILAGLGVRAGVSDILILLRGGRLAALELKAKGGKPTDKQSAFLANVIRLGGLGEWSADVDRSFAILRGWLAGIGVKAP